MASTQKMVSSAPAAPSRWPVLLFVELIGTCLARSSPSASLSALVSAVSPTGVEVACAFT